ncbi:MAG: hypothetical protein HYZ50_04215 [Deltaproteobacteria bacterium]|nr:hypothetical protein [Deltaproteobacteria bacterium]
MRRIFSIVAILLFWALLGDAEAQPQSPPSSANEREVRERLIRLEEGQKALSQQIGDVNTNLSKRIEEVNANLSKRIEEVNANLSKRIDDVNASLGKRIEDGNTSLGKRIDDLRLDMNSRLDDLMTLSQIIISTLVALVLAIAGAGLVMWRKILTVDAAVQTKIGIDQVVKDQVLHLEQEVGFVKGKLRELSETLNQR